MCEKCNSILNKKFVDRSINTADFDRVMIIGQEAIISGKAIDFMKHEIIIKGGGPQYKVAQMLSSVFNNEPQILELFEMAKELMPIMKQKTM